MNVPPDKLAVARGALASVAPSTVTPSNDPPSELLFELSRGDDGVIKGELCTFKGVRFVNIRLWQWDGPSLRPTRQGLTVRARELDRVIQALERARTMLAGGG